MDRELIEELAQLSLKAKPATYNGIVASIDTKILILFQRKGQCNHPEAQRMIEEIRKQYTEFRSRFNPKQKARMETRLNLVRLLEILVFYRMGTLSVQTFDYVELRHLLQKDYSGKQMALYKGFVTDFFDICCRDGYFNICKVVYENEHKYAKYTEDYVQVSQNQCFATYLECFFRRSARVRTGELIYIEEFERREFDKKSAEILKPILENKTFDFEPLPTEYIETYEAALVHSKLLMKVAVTNEGMTSNSIKQGKNIGLFQGEKENLILDRMPDFFRGVVHFCTGVFCEKPEVKDKLLAKSLEFFKGTKKILQTKNYFDSGHFIIQLDKDIDEVYRYRLKTRYEALKELDGEAYQKKFQDMKKLVIERIIHGEIATSDIFNYEDRNPLVMARIYLDMAKWTRLILKNPDKALEYRKKLVAYGTLCDIEKLEGKIERHS